MSAGVTCCSIMYIIGTIEGLVAKGPQSHAFISTPLSLEWNDVRGSLWAARAHRLWHLATDAHWGCRRTQQRAVMAEWHLNHVVSFIHSWTTITDVEPTGYRIRFFLCVCVCGCCFLFCFLSDMGAECPLNGLYAVKLLWKRWDIYFEI